MGKKTIIACLSVPLLISLVAHAGATTHVHPREGASSPRPALSSRIRLNALTRIPLGGIMQSLLVQGQDETKPVLLFLHGGPGVPIIPFVRDFDATGTLQQHFVIAYWDQRGAGNSYHADIPPESMNIEQFLADTYELVEILRDRFQTPKIYLVGHSWGSILGILTVARHPELFHAYVGIGQAVDLEKNEKISYQFALDAATKMDNQKALQQLTAIGPPPYANYKAMLRERKWVERFGGGRRSKRTDSLVPVGIGSTAEPTSAFPVVALDWLHGPYFSLEHLWDELQEVNLFQQAPTIDIPVYFLAGKYDYYAPSRLAYQYYRALEAPQGKTFVWFDHSAHAPPAEEPQKFYDILVNHVLLETYDRPDQSRDSRIPE
ncbi:MAG: alpha/beta fold hydrolase [Candidatus Binatia bacterium]